MGGQLFLNAIDGIGDYVPELVEVQLGCCPSVAVPWSWSAEIGYRHSQGKSASQFDVDWNLHGLYDCRVDQIGDGTRIVHRREVEALGIFVGLAEGIAIYGLIISIMILGKL